MLTVPLAYAREKSCGVKSAVLYQESHQQGSVHRLTTYVDDFGRRRASEVSIRIGKNKSLHFRHIVYDTYVLSVRDDEQTAEKLPVEAEPVNYLRLTPRITKKRNIQKVGEETVAGKPCTVYTLTTPYHGEVFDDKVWIWEGLVLKEERSNHGISISSTVTVLVDDEAEISPDKFAVPAGIPIR